jgi:CBS-domain-containing membrane protein
VKATDDLAVLVRMLSHDLVHRVLVWTDEPEPYVVSQRDLVRYFHAHNHELGKMLDLGALEMTEANGLTTHVQPISYKTTAFSAFSKLAPNTLLLAMPVLDDAGSVVASVSASDLRGLNRARLSDLDRPIVSFLKGSHGADNVMPVTCHKHFTFQQILAALVLSQAHRIWLCDYEDHVEGVVTLTDVIAVVDVMTALPG